VSGQLVIYIYIVSYLLIITIKCKFLALDEINLKDLDLLNNVSTNYIEEYCPVTLFIIIVT